MTRILPRKLRQDGDVGFGLSDLSQSIFASLGLPGGTNPLSLPESKRTCLLLVDGMGLEALSQYRAEFPIFKEIVTVAALTSHFPSTTVTNLTSLGTGELPGIHGMLGYTVKVPDSGTPGRLLNALKWDDRVDPLFWQKIPTLFERAVAHGISVANIAEKRYEQSAFTQASLRGAKYLGANRIPDMVAQAKVALAEPNSFAYLYINSLDHAGHNDGVGSEKWLVALESIAGLITLLISELPRNTQFFITADHGMVNAGEKIILGEDNSLMVNVTLVGGEPRARHIYVQQGCINETAITWREYLQNRALIYTKEEAIYEGLFGPVISEDSYERMGDVIAIPSTDVILIDPSRIAQESAMVGHHGGVTESEVAIPLLKAL
jgi:hypothetical protein